MASSGSSGGEAHFCFKTIIIGESNAGKSSILQQFVHGRMNPESRFTVGVEYGSRTIAVPCDDTGGVGGDTQIVKLQIWDTAGQDRFRSVTRSYYRGAVACMAVFSLADRTSYEKLHQWLSDAKTQARPDITILIVGNKSDLEERQVSLIEASRFAQSEGCAYVETSAKTGENVEAAFFKLTRSVLSKIQDGKLDGASLAGRAPGSGGSGLKREGDAAAAEGSGCSC